MKSKDFISEYAVFLNELAPGNGSEGNGPFDYGSAIITIGQDFVEYYADEAAGEDAADIIEVGKTFMSKGMTAGIAALFALDTQVYESVLYQLSDLGFNVQADIVSKRRVPRGADQIMQKMQAKFDAQPGQVYTVTGYHEFGMSSGKVKASSPEEAKQQFINNNAGMEFSKIDVKPQGGSAGVAEDWQKVNKHDKTDGMSTKAVKAYRREHPGSKLKTAVTTKPSKLKKGSKSAKRRASFCARMKGMKKAHASAKTKRDPDSPINKALRRWNCESVEDLQIMLENAERFIAEKQRTQAQRNKEKCWPGKHKEGTKPSPTHPGIRVNNCVPNESVEEAANAAQRAAVAINMKQRGQKPKQK